MPPRLTNLLLLLASATPGFAAELHVSPDGNDANPGTQAKPFATLERAQQAARKNKGSTVWLHTGSYILNKTFVLTPEDSGTAYRAARGETPKLTGGRPITGWKKVEQEPSGVTAAAKGKLWVADVPKGWRFHYLYVDGQPATRSQLNNTHWRKWSGDFSYAQQTKDGQLVTIKRKDQLANLPSNGDVEMTAIMAQYGVMGNGVVTDVNPEAGTLMWHSNQTQLGFRVFNKNFTLSNAIPFIDQPGEWCVDSAAGKVYIWPVSGDMSKAEVVAPKLYELVRVQGDEAKGKLVENVTLSGLTMTCTDRLPENEWPSDWLKRQWENVDAMLYVESARNCTFSGNRLLFSGSSGITLNLFCQGIRVEGNEIGWNGSDGIFMCGYGPGTLDVNKDNVITRNWIHDMGLGNYWHSNGVQIYQSGHNQITQNLVQNSAYSAISISGGASTFLDNPSYFFKDDARGNEGEFKYWEMFRIRSEDFPKQIQDGVRNKTYKFNRDSVKPYMHTRNNLVENNIVVEPEQLLDEGGAIYAWWCGKDNAWKDNLVFKSSGMPGSSILALDDVAEYFTITGNVIWMEGRAACGTIGVRPAERGCVIKDNIRACFKPEFADGGGGNRNGIKEGFYTTDPTREPVDRMIKTITDKVNAAGGWLGNPKTGIPGPGEPLKVQGEHTLPPGSRMTIQ